MFEGEAQFAGVSGQRCGDSERSCFLGHAGLLPRAHIRGHGRGRHALSSDCQINNETLLETLRHLWSCFPRDQVAIITSKVLLNVAPGAPCFPPTLPLTILTVAPVWDLDLGEGLGPRDSLKGMCLELEG